MELAAGSHARRLRGILQNGAADNREWDGLPFKFWHGKYGNRSVLRLRVAACKGCDQAGSSDWAVLCSAQGTVSLLVFFGSAPSDPTMLASGLETQHLQGHGPNGMLGFNWGIDPASPTSIHEAQSGMDHRPPLLDHDALADSLLDHRTIYHFYSRSKWILVEMPD